MRLYSLLKIALRAHWTLGEKRDATTDVFLIPVPGIYYWVINHSKLSGKNNINFCLHYYDHHIYHYFSWFSCLARFNKMVLSWGISWLQSKGRWVWKCIYVEVIWLFAYSVRITTHGLHLWPWFPHSIATMFHHNLSFTLSFIRQSNNKTFPGSSWWGRTLILCVNREVSGRICGTKTIVEPFLENESCHEPFKGSSRQQAPWSLISTIFPFDQCWPLKQLLAAPLCLSLSSSWTSQTTTCHTTSLP